MDDPKQTLYWFINTVDIILSPPRFFRAILAEGPDITLSSPPPFFSQQFFVIFSGFKLKIKKTWYHIAKNLWRFWYHAKSPPPLFRWPKVPKGGGLSMISTVVFNITTFHNPYLVVGSRISSWKWEIFIPGKEMINLYFWEDNLQWLN